MVGRNESDWLIFSGRFTGLEVRLWFLSEPDAPIIIIVTL